MDDPAVLVLLLEQGDRSLEDHTEDFVFLANYTHYPDNCLCSYYLAGLNTSTRAQLSGDGPRESLTAFIEWVLVSCKAKLTVDIADDDTSPTLDPEPSQPPPYGAELQMEMDEPEPAAVVEPSPSGATELTIAPEPEPQVSDQVREPTAQVTVDTAVEIMGAMESPAHGATAEGELTLDSGVLIDLDMEILFTQPSSVLSDWQNIPPSPTSSHRPVPLFNTIFAGCHQPLCSPSAHHLWHGLAAGLSISSSFGVESGGSLDSAFGLRNPDSTSILRPSGSTMASSFLVSTGARQSTSSTGLPRPSGSALVSRPPTSTSGLHSSGYATSLHPSGSIGLLLPSSSTSVLCRYGSAAAFRSSAFTSVAEASGSTLALQILSFTPALWLSVTASGSTTTCSAAVGRPHGVGGHSSIMAPPSVGSSVGHHRDCGLGLTWLLLLQVPPVSFLAPPSIITTLDSVSRPPPEPPPITFFHPTSTPFSTSIVPLRPSLLYDARSRLPGGGRTVTTHWTLVLLSACVYVLISSLSH